MSRLVTLLGMLAALPAFAATTTLSPYKGVWSSDNAEAVITDSICIFYCKADSTMEAILDVPEAGISSRTVFAKNGTVTTSGCTEPIEISSANGKLEIRGHAFTKVEPIKTVAPYKLPECRDGSDVGKCLQQWRLGAAYGLTDDMVYCEINTNRHMFVYMVNPSMVYIRAAATRNNNNGTLFFQNIRMMKNQNTGEYTMYIHPRNLDISRNDLEIDDSQFQPNQCTFSPDGGIYWSVISSEPDTILLNGCGETYQVNRHGIDPEMEYFEYIPYSPDDTMPKLRLKP